MPRKRKNGASAAEPKKKKLSDLYVKKLKPQSSPFLVWDTYQRGLVLRVQPTGYKSWMCVYRRHGRPRWYHLGAADAIYLADARKLAGRVMYQVAEGKDPAAERAAERGRGTFAELAARYVEEYAKKKNKSWKQTDDQLKRHVLPKLGKMAAAEITRADIKSMFRRINSPTSANLALASTSAVFSWAIKEDILTANPCAKVEGNVTELRERVLSDAEIPLVWKALDDLNSVQGMALKVLLLTGQRPGEVAAMRAEHIVDGWWELPGAPVPELGWPGTKNAASHRVWLPPPARAVIDQMAADGSVFGVARPELSLAMKVVCKKLKMERATPHDLRRTHGTTITRLGFGRDAMNRIQNHREGGIASVYDRHQYAEENKNIMETVARHLTNLVAGVPTNVVPIRSTKN